MGDVESRAAVSTFGTIWAKFTFYPFVMTRDSVEVNVNGTLNVDVEA
jgi:hypothetical protein